MDNFTIIKRAGFVSLSRLANLSGLLIITIILARYLSKSDFASYDQMWLIFNTIILILSFAFTNSIYFFGAREDSEKYIKDIFLFLIIIALISTSLLLLLKTEISVFLNNPQFTSNLIYFAPFLFFSIPPLILDAVFILKGKFKKLLIVTALTISSYILVVVLTVLLKKALSFIFIGFTVISFIRFVYLGYLIKNPLQIDFSSFLRIKEVLLYTTPLMLGHITAVLSRQVDKYIIANNFTTELYAIYSIGAKELPVVPLITSSFAAIIFPQISRLHGVGKNSEIAKLIKDVIKSTSVVIIPAFAYLFFFSKEFIVLLFSEKYIESATIFRIYLFFLPVRILIYSPILSALGQQKTYMFISAFDLILNITLGMIFVKIFGIIGPAIAVITSTYFETSLMLVSILKVLDGVKISDILPLRLIGLLLFLALMLSSSCYLFGLFIDDLILRFLTTAVIFICCYLLVLKIFNLHKKI